MKKKKYTDFFFLFLQLKKNLYKHVRVFVMRNPGKCESMLLVMLNVQENDFNQNAT